MGIPEIVGLIGGILKFFDQVKWLVQTLQKTPAEQHDALLIRIRKEADAFESTGRPTW